MSSPGPSQAEGMGRAVAQVVLLAAASLYFELAVIRFTSAEVLYLGYFSNFILISAFVGLALGFLAVPRSFDLGLATPASLAFLVALVLLAHFDASALRDRNGLFFFGNVVGSSGIPGAVLLVVLFLATAAFFAGIGQQLGRGFARFTPLRAYTFDILGSLLGIALFTLQAAAWSGPAVWMITGTCLLTLGNLVAPGGQGRKAAATAALGGACTVLLVLAPQESPNTIWSTYQKLEYRGGAERAEVYANGVLHQFLSSVEAMKTSSYAVPYDYREQTHGALDKVLVIGAGSGSDVAMALARGARSVDAVEIDPGILSIGSRFHPDAPYSDARVTLHEDDGRAFLRNSHERYDVIVFALPDSLVRLSSLANLRLESYLFTTESFADVRQHLKDDGIFVLYNQYRWDWLKGRIAATLDATYGHPPQKIEIGKTTVFVAGPRVTGPPLAAPNFVGMATDDWPHVYMQRRTVPWVYLGMILMFLAASAAGIAVIAPRGTLRRPDLAFFFMGAAFLLLETKSISTFSLLFGMTWLVNSMTFAGVLVSVLLANLTVQWLGRRGRGILFALLFGSIALAYVCPPSVFLGIASLPLRYVLAVAMVFAPIFFANLLFSSEFEGVQQSTGAFGWNLLGAVAGGGMEYMGLLTGQRGLLLMVAGCYALVAVSLKRRDALSLPLVANTGS